MKKHDDYFLKDFLGQIEEVYLQRVTFLKLKNQLIKGEKETSSVDASTTLRITLPQIELQIFFEKVQGLAALPRFVPFDHEEFFSFKRYTSALLKGEPEKRSRIVSEKSTHSDKNFSARVGDSNEVLQE